MPDSLVGADRTATANLRTTVSLAECALCQVHGEWTSCTEQSLRPSCPQQGEMPLAVSVRRPELMPGKYGPIPPAPQRCPNAAGSKGCAPCSTESSIRTSSEVRSAFDPA